MGVCWVCVKINRQLEAWAENKHANFRLIYIFKLALVKGDGEISEQKNREIKEE